MIQHSREILEMKAADAVRRAFTKFPQDHSEDLDVAVLNLWSAQHVDCEAATYVLRHANRFCLRPAPEYFDVSWRQDNAKLLRSAAAESAASSGVPKRWIPQAAHLFQHFQRRPRGFAFRFLNRFSMTPSGATER
jgi:hypothetical protein